jgi:hypothetical protein
MGAVRANVIERAQPLILAPDDEQLLIGDAAGDIIADIGELAYMPGIAPGLVEDLPLLALINSRIDVIVRRQHIGAFGIGAIGPRFRGMQGVVGHGPDLGWAWRKGRSLRVSPVLFRWQWCLRAPSGGVLSYRRVPGTAR